MLEEEGVVVGIDGGIARVRIEPKGTCESCASSGSCKMTPDPTGVLEAVNTPGARIGQRVRVTMKPGVVSGDPDLWAFGAGLLGLTATYFVMKVVYRRIEENPDLKPRIIEIVGE
ncbi:MAG: SoxR reducing system RseC family protein [Nitrospirae bacterium]|nr:SoxR reducing system RseC family protein [Nitrospirota bacterium]